MITDIYTHLAPRSFLARMDDMSPALRNITRRLQSVKALYDLDVRFRDMDVVEDYRQVISLPNPSLEECASPAVGRELARVANDELDEPWFAPFFARMAKHERPIWLHPTRTAAVRDYESEAKSRYEMWWCFGWPYDTSVAMARLVFSGLFDRHPELKIITHHLGAMIPFCEGRIGGGLDQLGARSDDPDDAGALGRLERRPIDYFRMFYGDTALFGAWHAMESGLAFFGADHVLFGTDFPFDPERGPGFIRDTIAAMERMRASDLDKAKIYEGNARRLLRLKPA